MNVNAFKKKTGHQIYYSCIEILLETFSDNSEKE